MRSPAPSCERCPRAGCLARAQGPRPIGERLFMDKLEDLIRDALLEFAAFVARTNWRGREREAVSLFAFGFLVPRCSQAGPLTAPTQIGLDVGVSQLSGSDRKAVVCKDLVVWSEPAGNCWDENGTATRKPLAILEWKARTRNLSHYDEEWLRDFSADSPTFVGIAISLDPRGAATTLTASRAKSGTLTSDWLRFPE
jgi:hypothetical protein